MRKLILRVFVALIASFILITSILIYRAYVFIKPCEHQVPFINDIDKINITNDQIERFQNALRIQTISYDYPRQNDTALDQFVQSIRQEFNTIEKYDFVSLELINNYSLLYKINGRDAHLKPFLLTAHFDVVVVNNDWDMPAFEATIKDGYIYARGTLDDKSSMISQLEAVRDYLRRNGQPRRTMYLAYGSDEEQMGLRGAATISDKLKDVQLEFVLDEGLMIVEDYFKEINRPIGLISTAEKGYLSVRFSVKTQGGHSSVPNARHSAIGTMANAINRLEANPHPSLLGYGPEKELLESLGAEAGFTLRVLFGNLWFFKPLLKYIFSLEPALDALQRTSTAFTMLNSGLKDNVLPVSADLTVNHRIHSLQSCREVLDYDLKVINDERIEYDIIQCMEPSDISPVDSIGFELIKHTTRQIYPEAITVPGVMLGATDSRFYSRSTSNIYKFLPIKLTKADTHGYHGKNERISIQNYENLINFYFNLIKNTDEVHLLHEKELKVEL